MNRFRPKLMGPVTEAARIRLVTRSAMSTRSDEGESWRPAESRSLPRLGEAPTCSSTAARRKKPSRTRSAPARVLVIKESCETSIRRACHVK